MFFYKGTIDSEKNQPETTLILKNINAEDKSNYNLLSVEQLKQTVIKHFLYYFCVNRKTLPEIVIEQYVDGKLTDKKLIETSDIPEFDKKDTISVPYSQMLNSGKITKSENSEDFTLMAFRIDKQDLPQNEIKLTSKGELIDDAKISLNCLSPNEHIENKRYLIILSGEYIDGKEEGDVRGHLEILTKQDFLKGGLPFGNEEILLDDIEILINEKVIKLYKEIAQNVEMQKSNINDLTNTFKLDPDAINKVTITSNDSNEKILSKVYSKESESTAREDAKIKERINEVKELDPNDVIDYKPKLEQAINDLFERIPEANRRSLTHYVARRKIVIDLFETILDRELNVQKSTPRKMDEKLLHNLIFQQSSSKSNESDLWLVNEDFVFFEGVSDKSFDQIKINGQKLIKQNLTEEEQEYRNNLRQNRCKKEPDILLFPGEGKGIIIEFKDPEVDLSDHLAQIAKYAGLLRTFADLKFEFRTFYGYLIGGAFDSRDIRAADPTFVEPPYFDYMFRPVRPVPHAFGGEDGSLYTEIISYHALLERAKKRNQLFLSKLEAKH